MISNEGRQPIVEKGLGVLTEAEVNDLNQRRAWVARYPNFFGDLNTIDGKLAVIDAILQDQKALAMGAFAHQTLGLVLGDAVAQANGMAWYMIDTNRGRGPCIGVPGTTVKVLPWTFFVDQVAEGQKSTAHEAFDYFNRLVQQGKAEYEALTNPPA